MDEKEKEVKTEAAEVKPDQAEETKDEPKLFTQAEIDKIVESRLKRYKAKMNEKSSDSEEREKALAARESKIACHEYLIAQGYSSELLDIIGTENIDDFKAKADKLAELEKIKPVAYPVVRDQGEVVKTGEKDDIASAFAKDRKHIPKVPKQRW